jgi:Ca2+-binding RTX toxin-like protein
LDVAGETRVNEVSHTGGDFVTGVLTLKNGGYLVFSRSQNGSEYQRSFASDGTAAGPTLALTDKTQVDAAALANGGYILTWRSPSSGGISAQQYDASGALVGGEIVVDTAPVFGVRRFPSVAALADGDFVVAWENYGSQPEQMFLQRFNANGTKDGARVDVTTAPGVSGYIATVEALAGGGYVVSWTENTLNNLAFRVYDAAGAVVGSGTHRGLDQDIAALPGGGFVIGWSGLSATPGVDYAIQTQTYSATGAATSAAVQVDNPSGGTQRNPTIAVAADGGYQVTWFNEPGGSPATVDSRRFDASGAPIGDASTVSSPHGEFATQPQSAALAGGVYVLAYGAVDGTAVNGYQQHIKPAAATTLTTGVQFASGDGADDTFLAPPGSLQPDDQISGEAGLDTVRLTAPGTLDFTGVTVGGVERIVGSAGDDTFIFEGGPPAGVAFDSGGGSDVLQLGGDIDLRDISLTGDWTVRAGPGQSTFVLGAAAQIPAIDPGTGILTVDASHLRLTQAQRAQLFSQHISQIDEGDLHFLDADTAVLGDTPIRLSRVNAQHGENVASAALVGGGYVQVWSYTGNGSVYVQAFNDDGSRAGPSTALADTWPALGAHFRYPGEVVPLADGGYVVTWTHQYAFAQRFDASHTPVGPIAELGVGGNPYASGASSASGVSLDDGGYLLIWFKTDDGTSAMKGQRFDSTGAAVGAEFALNGPSSDYSVTRLDNGGFVVTWQKYVGGSPQDLLAQAYDVAGQKVGGEVVVGTATNLQSPPEALSIDGGYAIFYASLSDRQYHISLKIYDNAGALVTSKVDVFVGDVYELKVVKLTGGDFVVAWSDFNTGLHLQRLSAQGDKVGAEMSVAGPGSTISALAALDDDGFVITYGVTNNGSLVHQVFSEYDVHTLTAGADTVAGGAGDALLDVAVGDLGAGDTLTGGDGRDIIRLAAPGAYQLDAPAVLTGFEELRGSTGDDQVSGSAARLAQFTVIDGGAGVDSLLLASSGLFDLSGIRNFERIVGTTGDDRFVVDSAGFSPSVTFEGNGGNDTLVVTGTMNLADLKTVGAWRVTAATGEAATLRMTDLSQLAYAHGEDSIVTVDASTLKLTAAERAQLFSQGVDYILQADAVFTPGGGLSLLTPGAPTAGNPGNVFSTPNSPVTAALANGGYVAVWQYDNDGAISGDIRGQFLDAEGVAVGTPFVINATTAGGQSSPSAAALPGGGFVVTWTGPDASGSGVYAQRFDASGARLGAETLVNTVTAGQQTSSEVVQFAGGYAISWLVNGDTSTEIRLQRFDSTGAAIGGEQTIDSGLQIYDRPTMASLAGGGFVLSWSERPADTYGAVYLQRFDATGAVVGGVVRIADPTHATQTAPSVAGLPDGGYLVAWASSPSHDPLDEAGAYVQRYNAAGVAVGERVLASASPGSATTTAITVLADGGYVVAWGDENTRHVYAQRFDAVGHKIGGQIDIDPLRSTGQMAYITDLSPVGDGFVASWFGTFGYTKLFSPLDLRTLTSGADTMATSGRDGWVIAAAGHLNAGDSLAGGGGVDTLENLGPGTFDLTAPATFSGFERLIGSAGDDVWLTSVSRLAGVTAIMGGAGEDFVTLAAPGTLDLSQVTLSGIERVNGSNGADVITGVSGAAVFGMNGDDTITGSSFADTLSGGAGDDRLDGGGANDTAWYLDAPSGVTVTLAVQGTAQATGGAGNDTLVSIENLTGSNFNDILTGNSGANVLVGAAGDDTLDGGTGSDRLYGGLGDDTFRVNVQGDLVFEFAGEGTDTVITTGNYYLYQEIENLTLASGAGNIFGVGNGLANTITGNEGDNLLLGGAGNDTVSSGTGADRLFGEGGDDTLHGDAGNDQLVGGAGNDTLAGGDGNDSLYGEDGNDILVGNAGTDILIAGAGADVLDGRFGGAGEQDLMDGGAGDDLYHVDAADDLTFEAAGGGTDTVMADFAGGTYYLYANVENLTLAGTTKDGVGNELDNVLTGNASANWLLGGAGDDTLNGEGGHDVLFGQDGADTFVFEHGAGGDVIGDFTVGVDKVSLAGIYSSFAEVQAHMVQNGTDSAIDLGQGDFVVFQHVAMNAFTAGDFLF